MLRGLYYQIQHPQGKLVRVTQGEVFDVAVDLRRSSPSFGQWAGVVLSDTAEFLYKTTDYWFPEFERSLLWSDSTVGIEWPIDAAPLLAAKDAAAKELGEAEIFE